MKDSIRK